MGSDEERPDDPTEEPSSTEDEARDDDEARADEARDEDAPPPKPRKKKRRKKKATKQKSGDKKPERGDKKPKRGDKKPKRGDKKPKRGDKKPSDDKRPEADEGDEPRGDADETPRRRIPWLAIILVIAAVELFLFGNRGRIQVCVGKEGVHDFGLIGAPRTDDNTASYPSCETRLNIGMKSRYDDLKTDAVVQACRRANMFRGKQAILTCAVEAEGWSHRVTADFVKPWEPEYYKKLFWFLE